MMNKLLLMLFGFVLVPALFPQDAARAAIRFVNVGDPAPYYFTVAHNKQSPEETSLVNPVPRLAAGTFSENCLIKPGRYYICGSYDRKNWGMNNEPTQFEANTEYLIMRIKQGEGYKVISRYLDIPTAAFIELKKTLDTPEKLSAWMLKNIKPVDKYGQVVGDQTAQRTSELKTGNCFDMAVFAFSLLQEKKFNTVLMFIQLSESDPGNHVVCLYVKDGRYYKIDNSVLSGPYADYKTIADLHDMKWWRYLIFDDFKKAASFVDPVILQYRE